MSWNDLVKNMKSIKGASYNGQRLVSLMVDLSKSPPVRTISYYAHDGKLKVFDVPADKVNEKVFDVIR